jgi:hypothetical protein
MAVPGGVLTPLDWIVSPVRGGLLYLVVLGVAMFAGFRSTFAGTWQRCVLWALLVAPLVVIIGLTVLEILK